MTNILILISLVFIAMLMLTLTRNLNTYIKNLNGFIGISEGKTVESLHGYFTGLLNRLVAIESQLNKPTVPSTNNYNDDAQKNLIKQISLLTHIKDELFKLNERSSNYFDDDELKTTIQEFTSQILTIEKSKEDNLLETSNGIAIISDKLDGMNVSLSEIYIRLYRGDLTDGQLRIREQRKYEDQMDELIEEKKDLS
jgi:hypothetical protein